MRTVIVALVTTIALLTNAIAGPRKVLVLPLDGDVPAEQKAQLHDSIVRVAKAKLDGDVTVGDTTFGETAAAVGCDPQEPACAETVRSTLGVDELVYGEAGTADGTTTVTVHRVAANTPAAVQTVAIADSATADVTQAQLEPAFGSAPPAATANGPAGVPSDGAAPAPEQAGPGRNFFDTRERKLGVGLAGGGVLALVIGLSLWSAKGDLQSQIDRHPSRTLDDLEDLTALEDRAGSRALWGNVMVLLGLGLGGTGVYFLYKDHKNRSATVTPAPVEAGTGMSVVVSGRW